MGWAQARAWVPPRMTQVVPMPMLVLVQLLLLTTHCWYTCELWNYYYRHAHSPGLRHIADHAHAHACAHC
jgi:hypothetical protein